MDDNRLGKLKGLPIEETTDVRPQQIKGEKPNVQLSNDGQNAVNVFTVGKIN